MPKKIRVCKIVFEKLLKAVKVEFERHAALKARIPSGKGAQYYGFGTFNNQNQPSLMQSLLTPTSNDKLAKYVREHKYQNTSKKHIYNLHREFSDLDDYDSLMVDIVLMNILALYINQDSFFEFVNNDLCIKPRTKEIQNKIANLKEGELSENELACQYIGFYYSYKDRSRKTLNLWINFFNKSKLGYPTKLTDLHFDEGDSANIVYTGYGNDKPTCSFIQLFDAKKERPFTLVGFRGHTQTKDLKYISYAASGVSQYGYPYCFEILFAKVDKENWNKSTKELLSSYPLLNHIDFYLQTERRNFRIPQRILTDISEIKSKGTVAAKVLGIEGQYRIWSIGYAGDLIQSKFEILPDFKSNLYTISTNKNYRKQTCMINISSISDKICVSAHPEKGVSVINYAIFDLDLKENQKHLTGVYSGIGINGESDFVAEALIVIKDKAQFEAKRISPEEIPHLITKFPWIKNTLLETLFSNRQFARRQLFLKKINKLREVVLNH